MEAFMMVATPQVATAVSRHNSASNSSDQIQFMLKLVAEKNLIPLATLSLD